MENHQFSCENPKWSFSVAMEKKQRVPTAKRINHGQSWKGILWKRATPSQKINSNNDPCLGFVVAYVWTNPQSSPPLKSRGVCIHYHNCIYIEYKCIYIYIHYIYIYVYAYIYIYNYIYIYTYVYGCYLSNNHYIIV